MHVLQGRRLVVLKYGPAALAMGSASAVPDRGVPTSSSGAVKRIKYDELLLSVITQQIFERCHVPGVACDGCGTQHALPTPTETLKDGRTPLSCEGEWSGLECDLQRFRGTAAQSECRIIYSMLRVLSRIVRHRHRISHLPSSQPGGPIYAANVLSLSFCRWGCLIQGLASPALGH